MPPPSELLVDALEREGTPWAATMLETCTAAPDHCAYGCCCPVCFVYQQRREILQITRENYTCCGGMYSCSQLGKHRDDSCLFLEACCCTGCALGGNRWMLQTRYLKQNDRYDSCIICCNTSLCCLMCLLQAAGAEDECFEGVASITDLLNCAVMSCMLAQHQVEIEHIKEKCTDPGLFKVLSLLPPKQQEMLSLQSAGASA